MRDSRCSRGIPRRGTGRLVTIVRKMVESYATIVEGNGIFCDSVRRRWRKGKIQPNAVVMAEDSNIEVLAVFGDTDVNKEDWVLDSGSAHHVCHDRALFSEYEAGEGIVHTSDSLVYQVAKKRMIVLQKPSGSRVLLTEVKHVPALKWNLLSLGGLDEDGYKFEATMGEIQILKGERVVLRGKKVGGIYMLDVCRTRGAGVLHDSNV